MKYNVTMLYYTYRVVEVEAGSEEEAQEKAKTLTIDDDAAKEEIVKNAILEGVE